MSANVTGTANSLSPDLQEQGFATTAIHAGYSPATHQGALNPPIYWSSTYAFATAEQGAARFAGDEPGMIYTRVTNPTVQLLEQRLAALEGGEAALAFSSGMGAVCSLLWTVLRPGDELLVDLTLYGCTHSLVNHLLPEFGIVTKVADFTQPDQIRGQLSGRTKVVLFETPANPNMRLVDIGMVSALVRAHSSALIAVDNTYCTPYLQRPLRLGRRCRRPLAHQIPERPWGCGRRCADRVKGAHDANSLRWHQGTHGRMHVADGCLPCFARPQDPRGQNGSPLSKCSGDRRVSRSTAGNGRGPLPGPSFLSPGTNWPSGRCRSRGA